MKSLAAVESVTDNASLLAVFDDVAEEDWEGEEDGAVSETMPMEHANEFADTAQSAAPALTSDSPSSPGNRPMDDIKRLSEIASSPIPNQQTSPVPRSELKPEEIESEQVEASVGDSAKDEKAEKYSYQASQTWALQGMKSLNVDLLNKPQDSNGDLDVQYMDFVRYDFQSLGGEPKLVGRIVRKSVVTLSCSITNQENSHGPASDSARVVFSIVASSVSRITVGTRSVTCRIFL
jgi:hypothetical protein